MVGGRQGSKLEGGEGRALIASPHAPNFPENASSFPFQAANSCPPCLKKVSRLGPRVMHRLFSARENFPLRTGSPLARDLLSFSRELAPFGSSVSPPSPDPPFSLIFLTRGLEGATKLGLALDILAHALLIRKEPCEKGSKGNDADDIGLRLRSFDFLSLLGRQKQIPSSVSAV